MNESAKSGLGARERRRRETYEALTNNARALTAERDPNGFTVEELCDGVGVSRRTFFNYFATKEDGVLGAKMADPLEPFAEQFVASGPGSATPVPLPDALLELFTKGFASMGIPRADVHAYMQAMHSEPALMKRMIETGMRRQRTLTELIVRREGLEPNDPYATLVSGLCSHLAMTSFQEFVGHGADCSTGAPEPDESPDEANARLSTILTNNFAHAARLFGARTTGNQEPR